MWVPEKTLAIYPPITTAAIVNSDSSMRTSKAISLWGKLIITLEIKIDRTLSCSVKLLKATFNNKKSPRSAYRKILLHFLVLYRLMAVKGFSENFVCISLTCQSAASTYLEHVEIFFPS